MSSRLNEICEGVVNRDRSMIGQAITAIEAASPQSEQILSALKPRMSDAFIIGITGPPGAGKSTLINALVSILLDEGFLVGALLVDPSSPRTKGAILGDRVRMITHPKRENLFTRSMASRGHLGGLSAQTDGAIDVMNAAGMDIIILETVGGGQSDVEMDEFAHLNLVLCPPGLGDEIQTLKAGVLEIANILVVTKSELPNAKTTENQLSSMVAHSLSEDESRLVVSVSAHEDQGIGELVSEILFRRKAYLENPTKRTGFQLRRIKQHIARIATQELLNTVNSDDNLQISKICQAVLDGETDTSEAVLDLIAALRRSLETRTRSPQDAD